MHFNGFLDSRLTSHSIKNAKGDAKVAKGDAEEFRLG